VPAGLNRVRGDRRGRELHALVGLRDLADDGGGLGGLVGVALEADLVLELRRRHRHSDGVDPVDAAEVRRERRGHGDAGGHGVRRMAIGAGGVVGRGTPGWAGCRCRGG